MRRRACDGERYPRAALDRHDATSTKRSAVGGRRCAPSTSGIPIRRRSTSLENYRRLWQDRQRRRADFISSGLPDPTAKTYSILIAGCGTSQAAKHAMRWPAAQVTGIDFSATSVRYTEELKRKYDLDNLEVHQLADRARRRAGRRASIRSSAPAFSIISPTPMRGCGALRERARSRTARCISWCMRRTDGPASTCCRSSADGSASTPPMTEIRDLIAALGALPPGHPLEQLLREAPDFRHEAALADALLHPQDRAYSVPQLFDFIGTGRTDIRPLGQAGALHSALRRRWHRSRRPRALAQLPVAEQYAAVELFRGTMVRHSVVAYRDDSPGGRATDQFRRRRLARLRAASACPTRSAFRSGCRPERRRC